MGWFPRILPKDNVSRGTCPWAVWPLGASAHRRAAQGEDVTGPTERGSGPGSGWLHTVSALAVAATLCLGVAPTANAKSPVVRAVNTLTTGFRIDNQNDSEIDDDYRSFINRLNLVASENGLSTNLRIDAMYFANMHEDVTDAFADDARIERATISYQLGDLKVRTGDFYQQLGRGIALMLRKVDEVGLDLALRGGRVEYVRRGKFTVGAFGGRTNSSNIDTVKEHFLDDPDDILAGGWLVYQGLKSAQLGLHGVYRLNETPLLTDEDNDHGFTVGGSVEVPSLGEFGSLYLESDYQRNTLVGTTEEGHASYVTVDLFFGDLSIIVEGIYLEEFRQRGSQNSVEGIAFRYNQPSTLDRIDQENSLGENELGGRLRVEYALWDGDLVFYVNGLHKRVEPGDSEVQQTHLYTGTELNYDEGGSRFQASGGFRKETQNKKVEGQIEREPKKDMIHFEFDLLHRVSGPWSVLLANTTELRTKHDGTGSDGTPEDVIRGSAFAGVDLAGVGSLTYEFGFDDTQASREDLRHQFHAAILNWFVTDWLQVRATGGSQRGGLKCIAGVCRVFPSFAGVRVELIGKYNLGG